MKDRFSARVLIVDDERANATLLEKVLEREGYTDLVATTNPLEALDLFGSMSPDIVLLDLAMPQMDGFEVLRKIRAVAPDRGGPVPVLVLTADVSTVTKKRALTSGANDFLTKPFEHGEVIARVANLLETRRLHLELATYTDRLEEEVAARTKELRETEARLFQSQKMDAVGQLAGGIAHDFNNLLAVIINYAILLLEDMPPDDPLREEVMEIRRAGESAATLTRQLLAFSRKEAVRREVLDLNEVVRGMQKLLHRTIGENIELIVDLAASLPHTKLDPGQLEQVLLNLAVNARDAMPNGGALTIKTFATSMDAEFIAQHPGAYPGDYVCIQVSDSGTGMTDEIKARVFEPFFTTKERGVGTGLGLATVYGVVKQADGYIDLESRVGAGSTFTAYFRATAESPESVAPTAERDSMSGDGQRILVVEDAQGLRQLVARLLTRNGFEVLTAENGSRALALADEHQGAIDLLLTDVIMPGMSGRDLAKTIRARHPGVPTILMSGYADEALGKDSSSNEEALLRKPFTEPELIEAVHDALRASRARTGRT